ncbi:hypothetical protein V2J09_015304 [Rumex salicifolius]
MAERQLKVARNLKRCCSLEKDMDAGNSDKADTDKVNEDSMNYHTVVHSDWQSSGASFANLLMGMAPDSFGSAPALWDHPANSQSMGFNNIIDHNTFDKLGIFNPNGSPVIPHSISQFPSDSAFIERAARFSCFSTGNITDMVNSFGVNQPINPNYHQIGMMSQDPQKSEPNPASASKGVSLSADLRPHEESPKKLEKKNGGLVEESNTVNSGGQEENSLIDTGAQPSSAKKNGTKRKRGAQDNEQTRRPIGEDVKNNGKPNYEAPNNGENGKQSSQTSDPPKEEYIHVRARRGQATNSHSLAERVRREKISERMKYLQDLVPGCSKVTGKAVMLDEIINYVQSLQRQVEFLSMKLATVNPRLDFTIESLLAKDQLFAARTGPPTMGFSPNMLVGYQQLHPSQPTVHNLWDDELHNVVQMGFNSNTSAENQGTDSLPPGKAKVEL